MDLELDGKVAMVTGGSGGIGSAISRALAREGVRIAVAYLTQLESARRTVAEIEDRGGSAIAVQLDVRNIGSIQLALRQVSAVFGGIDILVNCAGAARFNPLSSYSEEDWHTVVDTNLKGAFLCCQAILPHFAERGGGDIINISSLAGSIGSFQGGPYAASKAGMDALTVSLALELADVNVRVNGVAPGRIGTGFRRTHSGPYFDFMLAQTPQKRMGTPEEVANAVTFAASRSTAFMTGETVLVTGGLATVYLGQVSVDPDSPLRGGG